MRYSVFVTFGLTLVLALQGAALSATQDARQPNVILIISDDQSWTDYGFMGHPRIRTPHLDKLASQSAVFTRGYVTTALCRPSLATLATGLYAHQHGITGNDIAPPPRRPEVRWSRKKDPAYLGQCEKLIQKIEQVPTLPRLLGAKGYVSHQSGKWWEGHYSRGGFTLGMTHGDPSRKGRHGDVGLEIGRKGMAPVLDFIDRSGDKPFFVWYAPFLPHTPHNPPERLLAKYNAAGRPLALAKYYAMCEWFDETCGELLNHLDRRGIAENTLVVFIADNGWIQRTPDMAVPEGWPQNYAPKSKLSPHESGVRTPVMLRWPGRIRPSRDEETLVSSLDIVPTILSACGIQPTAEMSGLDLLPVCSGKSSGRDAIFGELFAHDIADAEDPARSLIYRWAVHGGWKIIRNEGGVLGRYRVTLQPTSPDPQLYHIATDRWETRNVAAAHPEIVEQLTTRLDAWWKP